MSALLKRTLWNVIGERFLESVTVAEVNEVSTNFRFIDLESEAFKSMDLKPGEKIQISAGDWSLRTYTPVSVNTEQGRIGILAYVHGSGPGSKWASTTKSGDALRICGPRRSLKLPEGDEPLIIFGDETAIAVAASIQRQRGRKIAKIVFEASMPSEVASIAEDMGLENVEVFLKGSDGKVGEEALQAVSETARNPNRVLLTGSAESVRQVRERLRKEGIPMSRVTSKAYWAKGKQGLD